MDNGNAYKAQHIGKICLYYFENHSEIGKTPRQDENEEKQTHSQIYKNIIGYAMHNTTHMYQRIHLNKFMNV